MEERKIESNFTIYKDSSELTKENLLLFNKATEAKNLAYAKYSSFQVGCAILLENGKIILGNNQENAAYPSGMCAERVAIWNAGSNHKDVKIKKLFIVANSLKHQVDKPVSPCGACRQAIAEYEYKQKEKIEIFFTGGSGAIIKSNSIYDLLPLAFDNSLL